MVRERAGRRHMNIDANQGVIYLLTLPMARGDKMPAGHANWKPFLQTCSK